jgi:NAD-dependent deacetylase
MSKKKIVIFSGAGISKESGVDTFRDSKDGLWNNYKVDEVATIEGWRKNRSKVLDFYNERRKQMPEVQPNDAHIALSRLEDKYDVTVVTQNVDDLHERGGSKNIIHLHGELTKACDVMTKKNKYTIGYNDIELGVKCPETDSQLRPDIVWFGEIPYRVDEAYDAVYNADVLLIVGTSLQISYTLDMLNNVRQTVSDASNPCRIVYIDPSPMRYLDNYGLNVEYVTKTAVEGVTEIVNELLVN